MHIREAGPEDFDGIKGLYAQLHMNDPPVTDGRDKAVFKEIVNADHLYLYIGELDGKPITSCYMNFIPNLTRDVSPYCVIENVITDIEFRNQGYGKMMMTHALDAAWQLGCYKVMLQTGSKSESVHNFYKSCGFIANDKLAFVARPR